MSRSLTPTEAAAYIGISARKLQALRTSNSGPRWLKLGRTVRYPTVGLDAWLADHDADQPADTEL